MENRRRESDRRVTFDRRSGNQKWGEEFGATWPQQRAQFITRYLFWALGLAYFNLGGPYSGNTLLVINAVSLLYFIVNTGLMVHARWQPDSSLRWRLAMWCDIAFVSYALAVDPNPVPPALLAYIMVVLGNGMRYGMRFFGEAVIGSFTAGLVASYIHYVGYLQPVNLNTIWVILFGGIIVLYAYSLMHKVDRAKQDLETQGSIDALTGLLNRRALVERAEVLFRALDRNNKVLAVLFADLNKFKLINDRMGHRVGDQVLSQIASLIAQSVRKADIAARYGGDEFVLVLPDADLNKATTLARRLQENLHDWAKSNHFDISMSIGIGEAPRHGRDLATVLENVDKAMYRGKLSNEQGSSIQRVPDEQHTRDGTAAIRNLQDRLRDFVHTREWEQFHSPKNLAMALIVEAGEMVEHFQWLSEEQSRQLSPEKLKEVEQELADIFLYLIRIADGIGVNLEEAAWRKLAINEEKYPAEKVRGSAKKYTDYS